MTGPCNRARFRRKAQAPEPRLVPDALPAYPLPFNCTLACVIKMKLSRLAEGIRTSPILEIAAEINARKQRGETLHNLTVGDFDSAIFPIPDELTEAIIAAYRDHQTNYPGATGLPEIRRAAAGMLNRLCGLDYAADDVIIASGSRPLIYSIYRTTVDPGERVVYPVPSWNNESYAAMVGAESVPVETTPENHFMPAAEALAPHLKGAALLALCAPQNPTGTLFTEQNLKAVCELVVDENRRRGAREKPLYVMFDQVYWALTFGRDAFRHPLTVCPGIGDYAIFVDGLSKAFAATGVRVGWATGPRPVLAKMSSLIAHLGAWAPRPEQVAAGVFLADHRAVDRHLDGFRHQLAARLDDFHSGFMALKNNGHRIDALVPQAALYLSLKIDIQGDRIGDKRLDSDSAVRDYLLNEAKIGILPFSWFGAKNYDNWFRLSVGTCRREEIPAIMASLESALDKLS